MTRGRFAYDPRGRFFAIACGPELLVHDGESEAPLWRKDLGEALAAIDLAGDELIALTEHGTLARFSREGRELGRLSLGSSASALAASTSGWVAAAHEEHVSILRRGDLVATQLPHAGVTAIAFSSDGHRMLLGTREGSLIELSGAAHAEARPAFSVGAPISAIDWTPRGGWLVGAADRVLRVDPGASEAKHVTRAGEMTITDLAASLDGSRFAMQLDDSMVVVLDDPPTDTVGQLRYPEMHPVGVRFGPGEWLGIALHDGDANKLDLKTGALHRSDTHPGRAHHSWLVAQGGRPFDEKKKSAAPRPAARRAPIAAPMADAPPPNEGPSALTIMRLVFLGIALLLTLLRFLD